MTKSKAKEIAKKEMLDALGIAYYRIADGNEYTEDEKEVIFEYMRKIGERMAKAVNGTYITY